MSVETGYKKCNTCGWLGDPAAFSGDCCHKCAAGEWEGSSKRPGSQHLSGLSLKDNRKPPPVRAQSRRNGISRNHSTPTEDRRRYDIWTPRELNFLKECRDDYTVKEMAVALNRPFRNVNAKLNRLGIRKKTR